MIAWLTALSGILGLTSAIVGPFVGRLVWTMFKLGLAFTFILLVVDQINDFLADSAPLPAAVTWLWFYFRVDLMLAFIGPVITVAMMTRLFSRT